MQYPTSIRQITSRLHQLSSIAKLFIIGLFWLIVSFIQNIFPSFTFNHQLALSIVITIAFVTNVVTEIYIYIQKHNNNEFQTILNLQIIANTLFLLTFLILIDRINGPLFLISTLTLMESSLNLNLFLPPIIVIITGTFTVIEWSLLVLSGNLTPDLINIVALILRIIILVYLMGYGISLAESILAAEDIDKKKDEFISITSHELRTPMTAIKAYLWMAISGRGGPIKPKQSYYLKRAYDSTDRSIKLVNDLLNISRIESGHISFLMNKVNLIKLVQESVNELIPRAKLLGIKIVINSNINSSDVIADADKIKEVVFNLLDNALKYSFKKGTILISFQNDNDSVITKISDAGLGMNLDMKKNLFQKFGFIRGSYQTNQSARANGTGLGLYICKQIITLHDGKIWGTSPGLNKGSTFSFTLPKFSSALLEKYRKEFQNSNKKGLIHNKV